MATAITNSPALRRLAIERTLKGLVDAIGGVAILILSLPILLSAMALIKLSSPGPVLLRQRRVGLNGAPFTMFKLRTMSNGAEHGEAALRQEKTAIFVRIKDDPRITGVGRFLRKYSIDELPQLVNVLRGDMSLVGPRPIQFHEFERVRERWSNRQFMVKPGLTGLAQVNGRIDTSDEDRVRYNLEYVDNWSLGLDLAILLKTIPLVLTGEGAV